MQFRQMAALISVPAILLSLLGAARGQQPAVTFDKTKLTGKADLGSGRFTYEFDTAPGSDGGNFNLQAFILNTNTRQYVEISPKTPDGHPLVLALFPGGRSGTKNIGTFTADLPVGRYTTGKAVLFQDGTNFQGPTISFGVDVSPLEIVTSITRVDKPTLVVAAKSLENQDAPDGKIHLQVEVRFPEGTHVADGNWVVMAKGSGGFAQSSIPFETGHAGDATNPLHYVPSVEIASGPDPYRYVDGELVLDKPTAPGVYNLQFGLFDDTFKSAYEWQTPGLDFEVGDWVMRCDPAKYPSRAANLSRGKAPFFIGGDLGNAMSSLHNEPNDNTAYYTLLSAETGIRELRENIDPDAYLSSLVYRHKVQQMVENMLAAGVTPEIGPQNLPTGATLAERESRLMTVDRLIAADFKTYPIMICLLNEPHDYPTWSAWKPVATRVASGVRFIKHDAYIVVDAEGYSGDMRQASEDPMASSLVNAYGWHSYQQDPAKLRAFAGHGIPVILEEYHDPTAEFAHALQGIPNLIGVEAWAWTTPGNDSLPLVASINGAVMDLTPDGKSIVHFYDAWEDGRKIAAPGMPAPAAVPASISPTAILSTLTPAQQKAVDDLIDARVKAAAKAHPKPAAAKAAPAKP